MKYLCQGWFGPSALERMRKEEKTSLDRDLPGYEGDLVACGHMIRAEPLQSQKSAVTSHVRNGKVSVTDRPYVETKEQIGGLSLIEANDLSDAIRIPAGIRLAKFGSIEIHPVHTFD
ncbi:hypothetical protein EV130_10817 [Rhizobium azibense]|uniref:YCII-related domain-containing protein n=1 Tax=Rhizobium azibense TaxID=1136135 RepID=A0A4R3QWC2_9HYPH|nr:YciI family protein [Rhizobium azibense]TCU22876.1 hypothetical protein EV130_10817 [Rhizobium azibense]TCU36453.1 hypothetical protein EV129_10717 [Rhizobium azibense]